MDDISSRQAAVAVQLLADKVTEREQDPDQYNDLDLPAHFEESTNSESPIFDAFFEAGKTAAIMAMINFDNREFLRIWSYFQDHIPSTWNVGRGKKCTFKAKDVLFMTLTVSKHGGQWEFLGRMFRVKGPTLERTVIKFLQSLTDHAFTRMVTNKNDHWTVDKLEKENQNQLFRTFKFAKYATDITFHQANRQSGNVEEGKNIIAESTNLTGLKPKSLYYPMDWLLDGLINIRVASEKMDCDKDVVDVDNLVEDYPDHWAILADKGYQGSEYYARVINPLKKPMNGYLSKDQETFNKKVSSDCIIVEKYFGKLCTLWMLISNKWRWSEGNYDMFFKFCLAMTNIHISMHPLRADDYVCYQKLKVMAFMIGEATISKRKKIQEMYPAKRKMRLIMQFGCSDSDEQTQAPN